jgi:hypothetical protein
VGGDTSSRVIKPAKLFLAANPELKTNRPVRFHRMNIQVIQNPNINKFGIFPVANIVDSLGVHADARSFLGNQIRGAELQPQDGQETPYQSN